MDGMVLYFHDLNDRFEGCECFPACTDLVASNKGTYFISLETVASSINSNATVVPYDTAESLDFFEGVFFYSSSVPQDFPAGPQQHTFWSQNG